MNKTSKDLVDLSGCIITLTATSCSSNCLFGYALTAWAVEREATREGVGGGRSRGLFTGQRAQSLFGRSLAFAICALDIPPTVKKKSAGTTIPRPIQQQAALLRG